MCTYQQQRQRCSALYLESHRMTISMNILLQFTYFGLCLLHRATCIYPVPAVRIFHFQYGGDVTNPAGLSPCILSRKCKTGPIAPPRTKIGGRVSKSRAISPYVPGINSSGWPLISACRQNTGKKCSCVTLVIVVSKTRKEPFFTHVLLYSFSIAQADFFICCNCCKAITGLCKHEFLTYNFHVPR